MSCSDEVKIALEILDAFGVNRGGTMTDAELVRTRSFVESDFPPDDGLNECLSDMFGFYQDEPAEYVTPEMAVNAGDPSLAGSVYQSARERLVVEDFINDPENNKKLTEMLSDPQSGNWAINKKQVGDHWYGLMSHPKMSQRVVVVAYDENQLNARCFYQATRLVPDWNL